MYFKFSLINVLPVILFTFIVFIFPKSKALYVNVLIVIATM